MSATLRSLTLSIIAGAALLLSPPQTTRAAPPTVVLFTPSVEAFVATINGVTLPGAPDTEVVRIHWDWGDGNVHDGVFPSSHLYLRPGSYPVTVTSFQSDGESFSGHVDVDVETLPRRGGVAMAASDSLPTSNPRRLLQARLAYTEAPPLIDPRVREALAAASESTAITWTPVLHFEDANEQPFNPSFAHDLLDAAGYGLGVGVPLLIEDVPIYRAIATLLWADWKANIGIAPGIEIVPTAAFKARLAADDFQAALGTLD